jgi:hypothetical protein
MAAFRKKKDNLSLKIVLFFRDINTKLLQD